MSVTEVQEPTEITDRWEQGTARLQISQDLSQIEDVYLRLPAQVYANADDPDIPGGEAMVMLGPRADIEAWGYVQIHAAFGEIPLGVRGTSDTRRQIELSAMFAEDIEPPLSFLAGWVDIMREERGQDAGPVRATISTEVEYLRSALDWMTAVDDNGTPWWIPVEDFGQRLHRVRRQLDVALGMDPQRDTGAPCLNAGCEGVQLVKQWAGTPEKPKPAEFDTWQCPRCKRRYSADEYDLACRQASRLYADRLTATDMLTTYRIPQQTLYSWVRRGKVHKRGRDESGRQLFDVPESLAARDALDNGLEDGA